MDSALVDTGIFVLLNPETGESVHAVSCERAAKSKVLKNPATGKPIHARTLKRAVAADVLPGGQIDGRWWIERDAFLLLAEAGWESLGIRKGPVPKAKKGQ